MRYTIIGFLSGIALAGSALATQQPKTLGTLELTSLAAYQDAAEVQGSQPTELALVFLDDSTIAVFVEFRFRPGSGNDVSVALRNIHHNAAIFTIDEQNLSNEKSRVWKGLPGLPPTQLGWAILPTGTSGCILIVDNQLFSLSHTLDVVGKRDLPRNPAMFNGFMRQDQWTILTDPGAKKALLVRFPFVPTSTGSKYGEAHWISPDTLEDQSSMSVPRWGGTAVLVGDSVIFNELGVERQPAQIQTNGGQPRPLCAECFGGVEASFGNGLVFLRGLHEYSVRDSNGTIRYSKKGIGGRADTIGGVRGAITMKRVAYRFGHLGRGLEETAVVLDVDSNKEIWWYKVHQSAARTEVDGFVKESFPSPTVAMSPDGKKLAIVSGTTLSVFEIP